MTRRATRDDAKAATDSQAIAAEILTALDGPAQVAPITARIDGFDLAAAYGVTAALRRLREARGEKHLGRKLGFTNRNIWPEYGVYAPIWGDLFDTTVRDITPEGAAFDLARVVEPKIEPEIAFGLSRAPAPGMDEAALMGCVGWIAHGVEIVQSLYPGWRFEAPDTVAAAAMHGGFLIGPRHQIAAEERAEWQTMLADFSITLMRGGERMDRGHARDVLGGPLTALRHLVALLAEDPVNPPLGVGEIVTTGTVTRALTIAPGEHWQTLIEGLPLPGLRLSLR